MNRIYLEELERHYQLGKKHGRGLYLLIGVTIGFVLSSILYLLIIEINL